MNKIYKESGLIFDFSNSKKPYKADFVGKHNFPMIDFVIETDDSFLLIEVKNPDNKKAREKNRKEFLTKLKDDYFPKKTVENFKNTLLRMAIENDFFTKPIVFILLLEFKDFTKLDRLRLWEPIYNGLPFFLNKFCADNEKCFVAFDILTVDEFKKWYPKFSIKKEG